jgi:hypothetical protein
MKYITLVLKIIKIYIFWYFMFLILYIKNIKLAYLIKFHPLYNLFG